MTGALFNPEMSLFNSETSILQWKINSETPGYSQNSLLHCGDVEGNNAAPQQHSAATALYEGATEKPVCLIRGVTSSC